jgi:hypothetical protein
MYLCGCRDCKKMRKRGKALGSRKMGYWLSNGEKYSYYYGNISAYVNFPKFMSGRSRKDTVKKWNKELYNED